MKLNEIIYELRLIIRQLNLYDDDRLDDRLIKHWVHNQRALWIRNEMNKPHSVDEQIIQNLGAVQLEVADRSSCPAHLTTYTILQTNRDIPKLIELNNGDGIIEIGPVDKIAFPFTYINLPYARFAGNGKWNSKMIFAFRYNNRILLFSKNKASYYQYIRYIRIRGVFENPEDVASFTQLDGTPCYSDEDDYPMNRWMWNYIREAIKKSNFPDIVASPTDTENDASETLKSQSNGNS